MTQDASGPSSSGSWRLSAIAGLPRLLIVEDNDDLRRQLASYFVERGWNVEATRSFGLALALAQHHAPHVILSELMLPDVRGYKLADAYRRAAPHPVRVIALTRMPAMLFPRALDAGFDEVYAKPIALDVLGVELERDLPKR